MFKDVENWVKSCVECSIGKSPRSSKTAPLFLIPIEGAFDRVAVDVLVTFPPSSKVSRYIVVFSDYLARWFEVFPVPSVEAAVFAHLLIDEIISRHRALRVLLSDRGTNVCLRSFHKFVKYFQFNRSIFLVVTHRLMVL